VTKTDAISSDLAATAARLASTANRGVPQELIPLKGGRNNRVFRVDMRNGPPLALKKYFSDTRDPRDRLAAEWSFACYAWERGVRTLPEPIAAERESHTGLYGFVEGSKIRAERLGRAEIDAAADFVLAVNAPPRDPLALPPGSEACFSLNQHVMAVERRVARLSELDPKAPYRAEADRLIRSSLAPLWASLREEIARVAARAKIDASETLGDAECCISPSDFGFHNALFDDSARKAQAQKLTFLDFEYAGRDDPAKLVCDFFCQPEIPVSLDYFDHFVTRLIDGLDLRDKERDRCYLLLDAYRIKWACIILNEFSALGAARRGFAEEEAWELRCAAQLRKAEAMLSSIEQRQPQ
jgi:Phosphotransferase enzyme family